MVRVVLGVYGAAASRPGSAEEPASGCSNPQAVGRGGDDGLGSAPDERGEADALRRGGVVRLCVCVYF